MIDGLVDSFDETVIKGKKIFAGNSSFDKNNLEKKNFKDIFFADILNLKEFTIIKF